MDWKVLYTMYNGLLGKCMIFIALSTPIAFLVKNFDVFPWMFVVSLIGAIIILIGFVICQVSTPPLIKKFSDAHEYTDYLVGIKEHVDLNDEFSVLEKNITNLPDKYNDFSLEEYTFVSIAKSKELIEIDKALRVLSIIKFSYVLQKDKAMRFFLTIILAIGSLLVFYPSLFNVYTILKSASDV